MPTIAHGTLETYPAVMRWSHHIIQCHQYLLVIAILCQNNDKHYIGLVSSCCIQSGHYTIIGFAIEIAIARLCYY